MEKLKIGIAKQALHNAKHNGDQCGYWHTEGKTVLCMVDGLGHGKFAERAANEAIAYVAAHLTDPLSELFAGCNTELNHSRGVVMGVAVIDERTGMLQYAGIGNIRAKLVNDKTSCLNYGYGIVGGGYKKLTVEKHSMNPGDLLILYTDGVKELISLAEYENNLRNDVEKLARKILLDWKHSRDDAAVLVYKKE